MSSRAPHLDLYQIRSFRPNHWTLSYRVLCEYPVRVFGQPVGRESYTPPGRMCQVEVPKK